MRLREIPSDRVQRERLKAGSALHQQVKGAEARELSPPAGFVENVLPQQLQWARSGLKTCLVTLVGVEGSSPRPLGSQLAVAETGQWTGQISSHCAEAAIAREALDAIAAGSPRTVRFGRGSQYLDVRLPCGSGLDIHFDPTIPLDVMVDIERTMQLRRPITLHAPMPQQSRIDHTHHLKENDSERRNEGSVLELGDGLIARHYWPRTRLLVLGRGACTSALISFATGLDWDVCLATPDPQLIARHQADCSATRWMTCAAHFDAKLIDAWTATVLLFHDHDWEPAILKQVLARPGFYVGALGSRATQRQRQAQLGAMGVSREALDRICGPVGLDIGAATPPEIALAIAAQIVAARRHEGHKS